MICVYNYTSYQKVTHLFEPCVDECMFLSICKCTVCICVSRYMFIMCNVFNEHNTFLSFILFLFEFFWFVYLYSLVFLLLKITFVMNCKLGNRKYAYISMVLEKLKYIKITNNVPQTKGEIHPPVSTLTKIYCMTLNNSVRKPQT